MTQTIAEAEQEAKRLLKEQADSLLRIELEWHQKGSCTCDSKFGNCYAAMYLNGDITAKQVVQDKSK